MKSVPLIVTVACLLICVGCTQNILMSSSIDASVLMNAKTSDQREVNLSFTSNIKGTALPVYGKNNEPDNSGNDRYVCDENSTLRSSWQSIFKPSLWK